LAGIGNTGHRVSKKDGEGLQKKKTGRGSRSNCLQNARKKKKSGNTYLRKREKGRGANLINKERPRRQGKKKEKEVPDERKGK